jgi:hypothetical protein
MTSKTLSFCFHRQIADPFDADIPLLGDQTATGKVADANASLWQVAIRQLAPTDLQIRITSSAYWLRALRETESFEWDSGAG